MSQKDVDPSPLLRWLVIYLTEPASPYYLPKLISNNALDPWNIKQMAFPSFRIPSINLKVDVTINDAVCTGLSSVEVTKDNVTMDKNKPDTASFVASLPNTDGNWPKKTLALKSQDVEISLNDQLMPKDSSITITVQRVSDIEGSFTLAVGSMDDIDSLSVTINNFSINPSTQDKNIVINLNIDSSFKDTINDVLNQPTQLASAIKEINTQLNGQDALDKLSQSATTAARQVLQGFFSSGS